MPTAPGKAMPPTTEYTGPVIVPAENVGIRLAEPTVQVVCYRSFAECRVDLRLVNPGAAQRLYLVYGVPEAVRILLNVNVPGVRIPLSTLQKAWNAYPGDRGQQRVGVGMGGWAMKAAVFTRYGTPDVLDLRELARPTPGDGEVLVRVHAASVNDWDWQALQGLSLVNRLTFGLRKPRRQILGSDVAGRIEALGDNAKRFRPGDEVFGDLSGRWGGFAEYVSAREEALAPKPGGLTFVEAAAIPQAAMLAVQGLHDKGRLSKGQTLLVNGAGGGVGTFAVQIAKLYGAETTGVDSTEKLDLLRSIGFGHVLDYTREDFTKRGQRYDLILDVKTNRSAFAYLRALNPGGVYVTVGGSMARLTQVALLGLLLPLLTRKRMRIVALKPNKDLDYMTELVEAGSVRPVIDSCYPLSDAAAAMKRFGEGKHKGKIVITME